MKTAFTFQTLLNINKETLTMPQIFENNDLEKIKFIQIITKINFLVSRKMVCV